MAGRKRQHDEPAAAGHDHIDEPLKQQLVDQGVPEHVVEAARAAGIGGGALRKLLADLIGGLMPTLIELIKGTGKGGTPPAPPAPPPAPPE